MPDMRVKLILDLLKRGNGAKEARADLKALKDAAAGLKNARGGDKLARDLKLTADQARAAQAAIARARKEYEGFGAARQRTGALAPQALGGRGRDARGRFLPGAGGGSGSSESGGLPPIIAGSAGLLAGVGGAYMLARGMKQGAEKAIALERVMYDVQRATDASGDSLSQYQALVVRLSKQTGKSAEEIGGMLAAAGFAGRPVQELGRFTEYAAKATTAWGTSAEQTGQSLAEIGNIYQAGQRRIEEIGDAINTAADQSAARETDLMDILRRAGPAGRQIGMTAEQVLALGAALKEVGTQPEVAATALNALFTNMSLGEEATKDFGEALKELKISDKQLKNSVRKDAAGAIINLLEKIEKIPDGLKRMEVLKKLFGREYADNMGALLNNISGAKRLLDLMGNKKNYLGSVDRDAAKRVQTDFNRIERANQQMNDLMRRLGDPLKIAAGSIAEGVNELLNTIEELQARKKKLEGAANKVASGGALTPDEAEALSNDPRANETVGQAIREHEHKRQEKESDETRKRMEGMAPEYALREQLRQKRRNLEGEIAAIERQQKLSGVPGFKAGRLMRLKGDLARIPWDDNLAPPGRGAADNEDRAATGERETRERILREERLKRLRALRDVAKGESRKGIADKIQELEGNSREDGGFHLGRANSPAAAGAKGKAGKRADAMMPDMQPAGALISQQVADGMRSGKGATDGAASEIGDGVKTALAGIDLSSAGQQAAATFAAGLRAGAPQVTAAAQTLANAASSVVGSARGGGGRQRIAGALHDGVV